MPAQTPDTDALIQLFYDSVDSLGEFERVSELSEPYSTLLDHDEHMTVAVERFHGCNVDVEVLDVQESDQEYARKVLLRRNSDRVVVQFGIVRLRLGFLPSAIRALVRSQEVPLGRILIEHDVMRKVELVQLWKIRPAGELSGYFDCDASATTCGRTALIHVGDEPAVELLEIVAPATP
jgi:chorismate-pyruvate lyase